MRSIESNKAKIANRVVEVFDFFDENHTEATVMDIVRRYGRPQSSTSELLSSLVNLGLLYKDPQTRSYSPTPRAAMLGTATQPEIVRNGSLMKLIDRLVTQTGLGVAVFGMVGLNAQIFSWHGGTTTIGTGRSQGFGSGLLERMSDSAVGQLLLSTIDQPRRDGTIRRLNAEATDDRKFAFAEMSAQIDAIRNAGQVSGQAGFGTISDTCAILLPGQPKNRAIAIGFVYEPSAQIDQQALTALLVSAVSRCTEQPEFSAPVVALSSAACGGGR